MSRTPTFEELKIAIHRRCRINYWPEQDILNSGHWRVNGDNHTFQAGEPNKFVDCGTTDGTRTKGIPWTRTAKNDSRARQFQREQPRKHFLANGQVSPDVRPKPQRLNFCWSFDTFQTWGQMGNVLWMNREGLDALRPRTLNVPSIYA